MPADDATKVVGRRVGAFIIDFLLTGAFYWGLFFLLAERMAFEPPSAVKAWLSLGDTTYAITGGKAALFFLIFFVVGLAYWVVLPGLTGYTLGKAVTGVRVVKADGTVPAGIGRNFLRQLVWIADDFPYFIPGLTGFIVARATEGHRRIGDLAASTYVVRTKAAGQPLTLGPPSGRPGATPRPAAGAQGAWPSAPDPSGPPSEATPATPAIPAAPARPTAPIAPAGWYPDPQGQARLRYWDGRAWTGQTSA